MLKRKNAYLIYFNDENENTRLTPITIREGVGECLQASLDEIRERILGHEFL